MPKRPADVDGRAAKATKAAAGGVMDCAKKRLQELAAKAGLEDMTVRCIATRRWAPPRVPLLQGFQKFATEDGRANGEAQRRYIPTDEIAGAVLSWRSAAPVKYIESRKFYCCAYAKAVQAR
eukprot:Skav210269  [mRNA]  locus=scaffold1993:245772:249739:+ [translate_table: standard]